MTMRYIYVYLSRYLDFVGASNKQAEQMLSQNLEPFHCHFLEFIAKTRQQ